MSNKNAILRYCRWYALLLRLYPFAYRQRFGESMQQTFHDILRERAKSGETVFRCAFWMYVETMDGILREMMTSFITHNKRIIGITLTITLILLLPLLAMQFSDEVKWSPFDFGIAAILLFGAGFAYELFARLRRDAAYRAGAGMAIAAGLLLAWINIAVGIIGSETNTINLAYFGVLAVELVGAVVVRFRPIAMARVMFATAIVLGCVAAGALSLGMQHVPGSSVTEIVALHGIFAALFVTSGLLFRHHRGAGMGSNAVV